MKRFYSFIPMIFLCVGCSSQPVERAIDTPASLAINQNSNASDPVFITATQMPTKTAVPTPSPTTASFTPTSRPTATVAPTPSSTPVSTYLNGPLLAVRMNRDDRFYLALLDLDTGNLREIRNELVDYPLELQWFNEGCLLFVRGRLLDLEGNIVWEVPMLEDYSWESWSFGGARLSPDKNWLIVPKFSGEQTIDNAQFVNLEAFNLVTFAEPIPLTQNGGAHAFAAWSPDGTWVAFSDYDDAGVAQLYRSAPDGENRQQLTFHTARITEIYPIVWKPDNMQIAYGALSSSSADSWLGLVNVETGQTSQIQPTPLRTIYNIWWSASEDRLVLTGDDVLGFESQIHWVDSESSMLQHSFYQQEAPGGWFSIPRTAGDVDTFFFGSHDGYYLLEGQNTSYEYWGDVNLNGLLEAVSSPFTFPGEQECKLDNYETND